MSEFRIDLIVISTRISRSRSESSKEEGSECSGNGEPHAVVCDVVIKKTLFSRLSTFSLVSLTANRMETGDAVLKRGQLIRSSLDSDRREWCCKRVCYFNKTNAFLLLFLRSSPLRMPSWTLRIEGSG